MIGHNFDKMGTLFKQLFQHLLYLSARDGIINKYAIEEKYRIYALFAKKYFVGSRDIKNFAIKYQDEFTVLCNLYGSEIIQTDESGASTFFSLINKNTKFLNKFSAETKIEGVCQLLTQSCLNFDGMAAFTDLRHLLLKSLLAGKKDEILLKTN